MHRENDANNYGTAQRLRPCNLRSPLSLRINAIIDDHIAVAVALVFAKLSVNLLKGIWQYIFLLFHCKELLKLYVNLLYRFCVTILFLEIF